MLVTRSRMDSGTAGTWCPCIRGSASAKASVSSFCGLTWMAVQPSLRRPPHGPRRSPTRCGLPRVTATRPTTLPAGFDRVPAHGWSLDDEKRHIGLRCVAAAILNAFGEPVPAFPSPAPACG